MMKMELWVFILRFGVECYNYYPFRVYMKFAIMEKYTFPARLLIKFSLCNITRNKCDTL